jgi:hypothetical protein
MTSSEDRIRSFMRYIISAASMHLTRHKIGIYRTVTAVRTIGRSGLDARQQPRNSFSPVRITWLNSSERDAPMWRNGRRNGLKIRSREKRGMGSNPIIGTLGNALLRGKIAQICDLIVCERSRMKTHEITSISQLFVKCSATLPRFLAILSRMQINRKSSLTWRLSLCACR